MSSPPVCSHVYVGKKVMSLQTQDQDVPILIQDAQLVGSGFFGSVYKAKMTSPEHKTVAVKRIAAQEPGSYEREILLHRTLDHCCISRLLYYYPSCRRIEPRIVWNLILEFMPCTLAKQIQIHNETNQKLDLRNIKLWMYQLACALSYLHSQNICHRDVKPDNLLLEPETGRVQLCDFGSAKRLSELSPNSSYQVTRFYRAPELALGHKYYGVEIDIWSLGCVLCELVLTSPLFTSASNREHLSCIHSTLGHCCASVTEKHAHCDLDGTFDTQWPLAIFPKDIPVECIDLITKLLIYRPDKRLPAAQVVSHVFLSRVPSDNKNCNWLVPN